MKKALCILIIFNLIISSFPAASLAQEVTQSASFSETNFNEAVNQAIQQLPDLTATISATTNNETEIISPYPSLSGSQGDFSASIKTFPIIRNLVKRNFKSTEAIEVNVDNVENQVVDASFYDNTGQEIDFDYYTLDLGVRKTLRILPKRQFKPGKYSVTITAGGESFTQNFTWGVLAMNTNKSIYLPNETAKIAIAVLDEKGEMVCDADVELRIKNEELRIDDVLSTSNGSIRVNPQCSSKEVTSIPDYEASYLTSFVGQYGLSLSAVTKNGTYEIADSFEVKTAVDFDIERVTATRIYPVNTYPVEFKITANKDFNGTITDIVPADFVVEQLESNSVLFEDPKIISQTPIDTVLGASTSSAKLSMPFNGDFPISLEFSEKIKGGYEKNLYAKFNLAGHDGIDFDMPIGTPILAADDGLVMAAGATIYGTTVVIEHAWGRSYYGHLSEVTVINGQELKKGEQVGLSGNTGYSTGPHLHFGVKPGSTNIDNGYYGKIDPLPLLGISSELNNENQVKLISWSVNLKKGETIELGYKYKAPNISPYLYRLGKLQLIDESGRVFEESRMWQIAVDAPNNNFVKQGSFTKRTSTGSQSVTGLGFKPKAIMFYWTDQTANGTAANASNVAGNFGMGFATGPSNERALSVWDEGQTNATTLDNGRASYNNASIVFQGNLGVLTLGIADLTSFDADGFTLNWSVANATAYRIYYYAFSETIISDAIAESFTVTTATGALNVTNAGFQPDFVFMMSDGGTTHGSNIQENTWTMGTATSSTSEWAMAGRADDGVDTSDTCSWQRTDAALALIGTTVACATTTEDALVDFTQFTSNGFDLNVSNAPAANMDVFYLALKGNGTSFTTGVFNKPTSAQRQSVTGMNLQPAGVFMATRGLASSTTVDAGSGFAIGAASSSDIEGAIGQYSVDNSDASTPDTRTSTIKAISNIETDAATLTGEADLESFDTNGFTLNWTTADATADQYLYWTIGEILTPIDVMRHGKWFHNGQEQPFAF